MNNRLTWNFKVDRSIRLLLSKEFDKEEWKKVYNIRQFGITRGYVTERQARYLGGKYKAIVNNGRYVHHDWWSDGA